MSEVAASPLLAEEAGRRARPLRAWSAAERDAVAGFVQDILDRWRADWGMTADAMAGIGGRVTQAASSIEVHGWVEAVPWSFEIAVDGSERSSPQGGLNQTDRTTCRAIRTELFGHGKPPASSSPAEMSIADEVSTRAWTDWLARLAAMPCNRPDPDQEEPARMALPPASLPWDGALRVTFAWCAGRWTFWLTAFQTQHILRERSGGRSTAQKSAAPMTSRTGVATALGHRQMSLAVRLLGTELTLGRVMDLREGDIVTLEHLLTQPLKVLTEDGTLVGGGWLGSCGMHKAIELTAVADA